MTLQVNNADDVWFVAREDETGAVTGSMYSFPAVPGTRLDWQSDQTTSKTQLANRAAGATRNTNFKVNGGLNMEFAICDGAEIMMESLVAGKFDATGKLLGGNTASSFYVEENFKKGDVVSRYEYHGCDTSSLTIDAKYSGDLVSANFQMVGLDFAYGLGRSTHTVAPATTLNPFSGQDVQNITIAGLDASYTEANLSIEAKKDTTGVLGAAKAFAVSQDGPRTIKLTLTGYREDFTPETIIGDLPLNVSLTMMIGGKGYRFELPAARGSTLKTTTDGGSRLWQVDFTAELDPVNNTDIIIQRLPATSGS